MRLLSKITASLLLAASVNAADINVYEMKDSDAIKEDAGSGKGVETDDNQLDRALDLLKSWNIFKQIENHVSSVAMESSAR